ncbi:hypothetical protein RCH05_003732, partial [Janthinobacterium sp. CAN_S7]
FGTFAWSVCSCRQFTEILHQLGKTAICATKP